MYLEGSNQIWEYLFLDHEFAYSSGWVVMSHEIIIFTQALWMNEWIYRVVRECDRICLLSIDGESIKCFYFSNAKRIYENLTHKNHTLPRYPLFF